MSIATKPRNTSLTLRDTLESASFKTAIAKVLPKHITAERMARIAVTALTRTPNLARCDQQSFLRCMMDLSQWGLEPDGRRAHLIPRENRSRGTYECTLVIDYKGLVELAIRSGAVSHIHCDVVCDNDVFEYDRGELRVHKIDYKHPRGEVYAVYCLVCMKDGTEKCEVLSTDEINVVRDRTPAYQSFSAGRTKSTPWDSDWNEMAKKTAFRRVSKWIPLSAEVREAAKVDEDIVDGELIDKSVISIGHLEEITETVSESGSSDGSEDEEADEEKSTPHPGLLPVERGEGTEVVIHPCETEFQAEADQRVAKEIFLAFVQDIDGMRTVVDIGNALADRKKLIGTATWSDELKSSTIARLSEVSRKRTEEIRADRGQRSNGMFPTAG